MTITFIEIANRIRLKEVIMIFDRVLREEQVYTNMSNLDIPETLHVKPEELTFENGWVTGNGFMFDPLPNVHLGVCGPLDINAPIENEFLYDTQLLLALLVIEGSCTATLEHEPPINLQSNMFMVGKWEHQSGKVFVPAGQRYCHVAFLLEGTVFTDSFGDNCAQELMSVLYSASEKSSSSSKTISGIASPSTIVAAKNILGMQNANGLDILHLRGDCLSLFSKLICNISTTNTTSYPISETDRVILKRMKERIEKNFLTVGSASELAAEFNMSFSKANNSFKRLYSMSIAKYIMQCKMVHAHSLLSSRQMNVSECAFEIGYSNISHFILAFKKHYKVTPKKVCRLAEDRQSIHL